MKSEEAAARAADEIARALARMLMRVDSLRPIPAPRARRIPAVPPAAKA